MWKIGEITKIRSFLLGLALLIGIATGAAGADPEQTASDPAAGVVLGFWKFLSGADGDRCPMHPSCSSYAHEAFHKHGLLKGWVMTCDRLIRCGRDETRISPEIWLGGKKRTLDPVDENDHWTRP